MQAALFRCFVCASLGLTVNVVAAQERSESPAAINWVQAGTKNKEASAPSRDVGTWLRSRSLKVTPSTTNANHAVIDSGRESKTVPSGGTSGVQVGNEIKVAGTATLYHRQECAVHVGSAYRVGQADSCLSEGTISERTILIVSKGVATVGVGETVTAGNNYELRRGQKFTVQGSALVLHRNECVRNLRDETVTVADWCRPAMVATSDSVTNAAVAVGAAAVVGAALISDDQRGRSRPSSP